jgi:predicted nucleic acid-binding protein
MADKKLMVDSTIFIDYFRKTDKKNSRLYSHFRNFEQLYVSSVTEFEIICGATPATLEFWEDILSGVTVLNFDGKIARQAAKIVHQLKPMRKTIDKPDLFIAATALTNGLTLDTANKKHFVHIEGLKLLT